jgi:hypothetical protein
MMEPVLEELALAIIAERQAEARHLPQGEARPGPLTAPLARLLVRLGLALDPAIGRELALQPALERPPAAPLAR